MKLHVIASGSKANSYVLTLKCGLSLLLDAGVSCAKVQAVMGAAWPSLGAVLLTHDHGDHARAAHEYLKLGVPVYSSRGTKAALHLPAIRDKSVGVAFSVGCEGITIKPALIMPFRVQHDDPASQAVGYLIQDPHTRERFLYATDFSCAPDEVTRYKVPGVHYFLIECNHCEDMLDWSDPITERVARAHLSLERLKGILRVNDMATARQIVLCHLSDKRSDEARMVREITEQTGVATVAARNGMTIELRMTPF
jgi:phosphoribosyl 1,2-cyclic phosphodiesterase